MSSPVLSILTPLGAFTVDADGLPLGALPPSLAHIARIDFAPWRVLHPESCDQPIDVLDVGLWVHSADGLVYEPAAPQLKGIAWDALEAASPQSDGGWW